MKTICNKMRIHIFRNSIKNIIRNLIRNIIRNIIRNLIQFFCHLKYKYIIKNIFISFLQLSSSTSGKIQNVQKNIDYIQIIIHGCCYKVTIIISLQNMICIINNIQREQNQSEPTKPSF